MQSTLYLSILIAAPAVHTVTGANAENICSAQNTIDLHNQTVSEKKLELKFSQSTVSASVISTKYSLTLKQQYIRYQVRAFNNILTQNLNLIEYISFKCLMPP